MINVTHVSGHGLHTCETRCGRVGMDSKCLPPRTDGLFVTRYHHTGSPKTWRGGSTIKLDPVISEHLLSCTVPSQKLMTDLTFLQGISLSFQYDVLSLDG